jgi:hypothetical protein
MASPYNRFGPVLPATSVGPSTGGCIYPDPLFRQPQPQRCRSKGTIRYRVISER